jgi:hypothetical protein
MAIQSSPLPWLKRFQQASTTHDSRGGHQSNPELEDIMLHHGQKRVHQLVHAGEPDDQRGQEAPITSIHEVDFWTRTSYNSWW